MSLSPGSNLGPHEIVAALGAGGMGEVYRARDPRLGREVAIKILAVGSVGDPERLRRFEQEAVLGSGIAISQNWRDTSGTKREPLLQSEGTA